MSHTHSKAHASYPRGSCATLYTGLIILFFEKILNATFIVLIPKQVGSLEVKSFRPTSLVNGVYKIISNVLANRLSVVMGKIITKSQNAFVKRRQILVPFSLLINAWMLESKVMPRHPL